ncbi:thrombospondin type 3 repeat-containing protein [Lacibacter cauensis]|uniref:Thrombospondin type 3 repeat-containing protein n=1 Tax=Lacibacter cauensis TaxID=510947 RepID=A0A562SGH8_9BACT|nr:OmpA family protein [Lacibacter cauensis]TWI80417.1 thrombospondin type 3 repeat-containing protein [Lacibacter cauensis]
MNQTLLLTAALLLFVISADAQQPTSKKQELLSYNISLSDYELPGYIKDSASNKTFNRNDWHKAGRMSLCIGVSYWRGLTDKLDFSGNLTGTFSNFPSNFVKDDTIGQAGFSTQLDGLLHLRAFKETSPVNPFLTAGIGMGYFPGQFAIYAPLGAGLQFRFKQGAYLFTQAQWRKKISSGINNDYLHYSISFAQDFPFGKKKVKDIPVDPIPVEPVLPPDADGDGFADANDLCPAVKGTVNGCPDSDGDGVADKDDKCPNDKGTLNGCPDSDNDGVADKDDQCPNDKGTLNGCPDSDNDAVADKDDQCKDVAGLQRYNGCPIPDSDKDGVNDEQDKCPNEAGILANNGCPEIKQEVKQKIEFAAKNIFFQFASDVILKKSYASLNEVVTVLQQNPSLKLSISAHADNLGTPDRNLMWSERRAKAVADYFISKGIAADRIMYKGYGDTQPIASNKTAKGRAANRRVEMKVDY